MKDLDKILSLIAEQRLFLDECDIIPALGKSEEIENIIFKLKAQQSLITEPQPFPNFSI